MGDQAKEEGERAGSGLSLEKIYTFFFLFFFIFNFVREPYVMHFPLQEFLASNDKLKFLPYVL